MRESLLVLCIIVSFFSADSQSVVTAPAVPSPSQPVTITFDVTGTDFASKNLNDVWLWAWLDNGANDVNAPTNINPATAAQDDAKVTRSSTNPNIYFITITATTFFNKPASEIGTVGVLLKGRDWSNGQTADKFITFSESFAVGFALPASSLFFVDAGESVEIKVDVNEPSAIALKIGNDIIASSTGEVTEFTYNHVVTETSGSVTILAEANNGTEIQTATFIYVVRTATMSEERPAGIVDGINYETDQTTATLSLWAPGKTTVYVLGDFNNWQVNPLYQMKQDGEHFWLKVTGLTPGEEYAFQYLVDETLKIADPYADKILDPDDQYIPEAAYPNLKPFPSGAMSDEWYFNRLSVLRTGQVPYAWVVNDFQKPEKEKLVIYELLIRDYFGTGEANYQNLIDTLGYLKRLGVNAIELMPVTEYNGNESWGYNPTFMFALDKFYGTKNKFKEFVDKCHQNGIAVIVDIVMNHQDIPNPYVMMDFDFVNMKPKPTNKWFNVEATHPFNVFFDMNHESAYTKKYLDTVNYYWLNEYKIDGYRFDLSKGFTQTNNPSNVGAWSNYDASRIAILKRMADRIWEHTPNAYVILEHLSVNSEEKELAEYRADEGKGMMLWGKMTDQYNQLTMGYADNSDISGVYFENRDWSVPHLISYMESHDEERLMMKNVSYGNVTADYSVKDTLVALSRVRAASTLFYTIPGPKMLWQFGELGYDYSINYCPDGTINEGCRVANKPVRWDYQAESHRRWLYDHTRDLIRLRNEFDLFTNGVAEISSGNSLVKQVVLKNSPYNPAPSSSAEMNAVIVANFDVVERDIQVVFPHTGGWYDYYVQGQTLDVSEPTSGITLAPGGVKLYTDIPLESTVITSTERSAVEISFYPNPVGDRLTVEASGEVRQVSLITTYGERVILEKESDDTWNVSKVPNGLFIAEVTTASGISRVKLIKR